MTVAAKIFEDIGVDLKGRHPSEVPLNEIRAAHRKTAAQHHPDRHHHASPEVQAAEAARMQNANTAYDILMTSEATELPENIRQARLHAKREAFLAIEKSQSSARAEERAATAAIKRAEAAARAAEAKAAAEAEAALDKATAKASNNAYHAEEAATADATWARNKLDQLLHRRANQGSWQDRVRGENAAVSTIEASTLSKAETALVSTAKTAKTELALVTTAPTNALIHTHNPAIIAGAGALTLGAAFVASVGGTHGPAAATTLARRAAAAQANAATIS